MLFKRIAPIALTIAIGWLVLVSLLLRPLGISLAGLPTILIEWAVILAAFALVLGYINLIGVHLRRIQEGEGILYSLLLVLSSVLILTLWLVDVVLNARGQPLGEALQRPDFLNRIFDLLILPMQSALGVLLAILLAIIGFRALRTRRSVGMILFIVSAIIVAITQSAVPPIRDVLGPIRTAIIDPITTGSLRGLLLGVALGAVIVGLRLLVGADKPQSD
jgi:hypothetical protein